MRLRGFLATFVEKFFTNLPKKIEECLVNSKNISNFALANGKQQPTDMAG